MSLKHMPKYVLDSYAWIEYFLGSYKGEKVGKIVESESNELFTPSIVVAEVASITSREKRDAEQAYKNILMLSKTYPLDHELAKEAGILHAEMRKKMHDFGMADAVILLTARKLSAKVVTGDPHFKNIKDVIFIEA